MRFLLIIFIFTAQIANAAELQKGINLSSWLANASRQPLYEQDFKLIKDAGFDNIRLPVAPENIDSPELTKAFELAKKYHLSVVLDIHPHKDFALDVENESTQKEFIKLWQKLATRYKDQKMVFELLNEPQFYRKEAQYQQFMGELVAAIRQIDKTRTLIIAAPNGSSIAGLQKLKAITATNIIYDFHFYEPYIITHQGVRQGFATKMIRYFHNLPYPAKLAMKENYAPNASNSEQAQKELQDYKNENWDIDKIRERIAVVKEWAEKNHAQVICGEFGVLRANIEATSRYRWIKDVRTALEENQIGWQVWDYSDVARITTMIGKTKIDINDDSERFINPQTGIREFEPQVKDALGLISRSR